MIRYLLNLILLLAATTASAADFAQRADVRAFVAEVAGRDGFDSDRLLAHFRKVKPSPAVLKAIAPPADPGIRSWQAYRARFVEPTRIAGGLDFWRRHEAAIARAEATYGVPAEIIVAIIGVETIYGRHTGRFHVFNALANLAFDYPPRADLFRRELEALLLLARDEKRAPWSYRGSYAGAMGLPQFLPSSVRAWAVDFDRDGHIDLAGNGVDAIGSVGRFLAEHGWQRDGLIAEPTAAPADAATWDGSPPRPTILIDLATPGAATEYRLGYNNFYVLTRYNRSSFYASAVMDLAEALRAAHDAL